MPKPGPLLERVSLRLASSDAITPRAALVLLQNENNHTSEDYRT